MNSGTAKDIARLAEFDTKAERKYQRDPRTGTIHANVQRKAYQKMKKQYRGTSIG